VLKQGRKLGFPLGGNDYICDLRVEADLMDTSVITEGKFRYIEFGEGTPIVVLHGLMGGLSNFGGVSSFFPEKGYKVILPELPIYDMPMLKTTVKHFAKFVAEFLEHKGLDEVLLLGNSLGGHVGLLFTKMYPEKVKGLIITGSSGLYESAMGDSYPKRGSYEFIEKKAQDVFYDPAVATKEIVDEVYATVNDRVKLVKTLAIAKSPIRHNMAKDLPKMPTPTCIIWGKNDSVTPPEVAEEFHSLLPDSDLYWIDKCGHAPMMEHPDTFNELLYAWLLARKFQ
jgi:pimeloyl-ACP methyl ester carboxylesterase